MRAAFIKTLINIAKTDERIFLLVGDVGFHLVEPFAQEFPSRFINIGIAEQNMTGIAAGLALCDKIVFTYSLANFPTLRCLEQIRNDACYHNANVKVVSSGGGLAYGSLGATHHVTEDLAIMRALPNMTVIAPGDPVEAALATQGAVEQHGPCYLRLVGTGDPIVHQKTPQFQIGKAIKLQSGGDITLITTGAMLENTVLAAKQLRIQGIQSCVLSMHTIKPLDTEAILSAAQETHAILTIEEHSIIGGLGGAISETLAESNISVVFKRMGTDGLFCHEVGDKKYLRAYYALTIDGIINTAKSLFRTKP